MSHRFGRKILVFDRIPIFFMLGCWGTYGRRVVGSLGYRNVERIDNRDTPRGRACLHVTKKCKMQKLLIRCTCYNTRRDVAMRDPVSPNHVGET